MVKLYYDPVNNVICTDLSLSIIAPHKIQKLSKTTDIVKAIVKGMMYIYG